MERERDRRVVVVVSLPRMKMPSKVQAFFERAGKQGGEARAKSLTPARRKEIAAHASKTRWAKKKPAALKQTA